MRLPRFKSYRRIDEPRPEERACARLEGQQAETEPAAILRDGALRLLRMRSVGFKLRPPDPIGFMELICKPFDLLTF